MKAGDLYWFMGSRYVEAQKGTVGEILITGNGQRLINMHLEDGVLISHVQEKSFNSPERKFIPFEEYLEYRMRVLTCHRVKSVKKPL